MRLKTSVSRTITNAWSRAFAVVICNTRDPVSRFLQKPDHLRIYPPGYDTTCGWRDVCFQPSSALFAPEPLPASQFESSSYAELKFQGRSPVTARQILCQHFECIDRFKS